MSHEHVEVRAGAYADSVALLQVSRTVAGTPGVEAAQVAMATDLNLEVLAQMGFTLPATTPDAMVVGVCAKAIIGAKTRRKGRVRQNIKTGIRGATTRGVGQEVRDGSCE